MARKDLNELLGRLGTFLQSRLLGCFATWHRSRMACQKVRYSSIMKLCTFLTWKKKTYIYIENTPLQKHQPEIVECDVTRIPHREVLVPPSQMDITESTPSEDVQEHCNALSEWLAMVALESPRVTANDTIDPYLSRYSVPDANDSNPTNLISLKWHGFINSRWITRLLTTLLY